MGHTQCFYGTYTIVEWTLTDKKWNPHQNIEQIKLKQGRKKKKRWGYALCSYRTCIMYR